MGWLAIGHTDAVTRSPEKSPAAEARQDPRRSEGVSLPPEIEALYRRLTGRDSDLEAFSHYPTDGSLAPLADRPST